MPDQRIETLLVAAGERFEFARDEDGTIARIQGYALRWDDIADRGWFRMKFEPGAFKDTLANRQHDQVVNLGHGGPPIARRRRNTLSLTEDSTGLAFKAEIDTRDGDARDAAVKVERGDYSGMSVGFSMLNGATRWENMDTEEELRIIEKVGELFEVSLTDRPAMTGSDVVKAERMSVIAAINETKFGRIARARRLRLLQPAG